MTRVKTSLWGPERNAQREVLKPSGYQVEEVSADLSLGPGEVSFGDTVSP